jgi:hypothetical protein
MSIQILNNGQSSLCGLSIFLFIKLKNEKAKVKKEIRKRDENKKIMEKGTQREIEGHWSR